MGFSEKKLELVRTQVKTQGAEAITQFKRRVKMQTEERTKDRKLTEIELNWVQEQGHDQYKLLILHFISASRNEILEFLRSSSLGNRLWEDNLHAGGLLGSGNRAGQREGLNYKKVPAEVSDPWGGLELRGPFRPILPWGKGTRHARSPLADQSLNKPQKRLWLWTLPMHPAAGEMTVPILNGDLSGSEWPTAASGLYSVSSYIGYQWCI